MRGASVIGRVVVEDIVASEPQGEAEEACRTCVSTEPQRYGAT